MTETRAAVDESPWDGNKALSGCDDAADFRAICAGEHSVGDPDERQHWALPHHYLSSQGKAGPPNAAGVAAARGRVGQTQDLTNRSAAESHLAAHEATIEAARGLPMLETRSIDLANLEVRHSGRADESFTVRGYAAIYDQPSLDLGGFKEVIDSRALDDVLSTNPDVVFAWEHDARYVGARTANGTLTLRNDPQGLWIDARIGPYSWAKDLRTGLERRDITQGSFGYMASDDGLNYELVGDTVVRTVRSINFLGDVTVTAQGAFPQTNMVAAARSLHAAVVAGRLSPDIEERVAQAARASSIDWPVEAALVALEEEGEQASQQGAMSPELERRVADLKARMVLRHSELAELSARAERL